MDLSEDEEKFLKDLVKAARQRTTYVKWVDRDGTDRVTSLTQPEAVRLNILAQRMGTSKQAVLQQAAHIPVNR